MKLVSWNLNGLEERNLDMRSEAAMFQILLGAPIEAAFADGFAANSPDIIVLQEVVDRTYHAHLLPHFKAAGFNVYTDTASERSYFEVIAVREKNAAYSYTPFAWSDQGRGLSVLTLGELTIMTAHLESMRGGSPMRLDQAQFVLDQMPRNSPCIFAGDTNLRRAEWQELKHGDIQDAWISSGSPNKYRYTWQHSQKQQYRARYGRIWATPEIKVQEFETFAREKVSEINERASDHLAMRTTFTA